MMDPAFPSFLVFNGDWRSVSGKDPYALRLYFIGLTVTSRDHSELDLYVDAVVYREIMSGKSSDRK